MGRIFVLFLFLAVGASGATKEVRFVLLGPEEYVHVFLNGAGKEVVVPCNENAYRALSARGAVAPSNHGHTWLYSAQRSTFTDESGKAVNPKKDDCLLTPLGAAVMTSTNPYAGDVVFLSEADFHPRKTGPTTLTTDAVVPEAQRALAK